MKTNVLAYLFFFTSITLFAQDQINVKPSDWVGDFIERISLSASGFEMDMRFEKSYHEMKETVTINETMVSVYPVNVEQYAYFLQNQIDNEKEVPEDWIPTAIAITGTKKVTFNEDDGEQNAEGISIEGARAFCTWLSDWLNTGRQNSRLPLLPTLRLTTVGESVMAMSSFVKIKDSDYQPNGGPLDDKYIRMRNEEIRSYTVFYDNGPERDLGEEFTGLEAGVLHGEKKYNLDDPARPAAGFYVCMSVTR